VLRYAHEKPKLTRWSDNVRILELLAQNGIMEEQEAQALTRAYTRCVMNCTTWRCRNFRAMYRRHFVAERALVRDSWQVKWLVAE
jgi:glutamate-ammonia-ligase adenylyltransferase